MLRVLVPLFAVLTINTVVAAVPAVEDISRQIALEDTRFYVYHNYLDARNHFVDRRWIGEDASIPAPMQENSTGVQGSSDILAELPADQSWGGATCFICQNRYKMDMVILFLSRPYLLPAKPDLRFRPKVL